MPVVDKVRRLFSGSKQRAFPNLSSAERRRYKSLAGQVKSGRVRRNEERRDERRLFEQSFFKRDFVQRTAELDGMAPDNIFVKSFLQLDSAKQDVMLNRLLRVFSHIGSEGGYCILLFCTLRPV